MADQFQAVPAAVAGWHVVDAATNHRVETPDGHPRVWLWAQDAVAYAARLNDTTPHWVRALRSHENVKRGG